MQGYTRRFCIAGGRLAGYPSQSRGRIVSDVPLTAAFWRERAHEARAIADRMSDEFARPMMLEIARMYERLAKRAASQRRTKTRGRGRQ